MNKKYISSDFIIGPRGEKPCLRCLNHPGKLQRLARNYFFACSTSRHDTTQ